MTFKPITSARDAEITDGDTLESIAERERAAGNDITADDIATFNWGTDDPEYVQELLRDELGATQRTEPHAFVLSPDDQARSTLKIPEPFRAAGLSTDRLYKLHVRRRACPKQFLACSGIPSAGFDFDSSFLRPEVKPALKEAEQIVAAYPDSMMFVFGHTDAVGDDIYNKKLSERRAWCVYAFLIKDPAAWETLYEHPDEHWGVAAIQTMLEHLGHDPGGIDGDLGDHTKDAMRSFLGLDPGASVHNDQAFRLALFEAYMTGPDDAAVPADRFCGHGFQGCGEFNLAQPDDGTHPDNRRVTLFAFHRDRLPNMPCAFADVAPCKARIAEGSPRYNPGFSCSYYDTVAEPCHAENEHHSVSLLLRKYPVDSDIVSHLMDQYRLESKCGKLGEMRKAMSAGTRDETYVQLTWPHVRQHMSLSLVQRVGSGQRVLLSEVPFAQLRADGHLPTEPAQDIPPPQAPPTDVVDPAEVEDRELDVGPAPWESEY